MNYYEEVHDKNLKETIDAVRNIETDILNLKLTVDEYDKFILYEMKKSEEKIKNLSNYVWEFEYGKKSLNFGKQYRFFKSIMEMIDILGLSVTMKAISFIDYSLEAYQLCYDILGQDHTLMIRNMIQLLREKEGFTQLQIKYPLIIADIVFKLIYFSQGNYYGTCMELITFRSELEHIRTIDRKEDRSEIYRLPVPLKTVKIAILSMENMNLMEVLKNVKS